MTEHARVVASAVVPNARPSGGGGERNDAVSDDGSEGISLALNMSDEDVRFLVILSTAAKCAVLRLGAAAPAALLDRFLQCSWLPLLRYRHPALDPAQSQVVTEIVDALSETEPWDVVSRALLLCVGSLPVTFPRGQEPNGFAGRLPFSESLRVETAAALGAALLSFAAGAGAAPLTSEQQTLERRRTLLAGTQLLSATVASASAMVSKQRQLVTATMVPAGLNAAHAMGRESYERVTRALARTVREKISPETAEAERAVGWAVVSLVPAPVLGQPGAAAAAVRGAVARGDGAKSKADLALEYEMDDAERLAVVRSAVESTRLGARWEPPDLAERRRDQLVAEMRKNTDDGLLRAMASGLGSDDVGERKAALAALRHCVGDEEADASPWAEFIGIYSALEDFAAHLVDAAWTHLDVLHPMAESRTPDSVWEPPVNYRYVMAIWTRGLRHSNPTVRRTVLEALCARDWSAENALRLCPRFVCEVLLPCAMGNAKTGNGAGGTDAKRNERDGVSRAADSQDATAETVGGVSSVKAVGRVCAAWVAALGAGGQSAALAVAAAVAEKCQAAESSLSPSGLDTAVRAVEAAAAAAEITDTWTLDDGAAFLDSLTLITRRIAQKPGPEAQTRLINLLMLAARHLAPPGRAPLQSIRALLVAIPPELLGSGPAAGVRPHAAHWLANGEHLGPSSDKIREGGGSASALADPAAIGRRLMSGMSAADALAVEARFDPADAAALWIADSLLTMFVAFLDRQEGGKSTHADAEVDALEDADRTEMEAYSLALVFSFTSGRDLVAQSRLLTAVTVALPRHVEPSGDYAPAPNAGDNERLKTWRGERALMLLRALFRLGVTLGVSPAAAATAAPASADTAVASTFVSGGVGVGFEVVDGGFDAGDSTPATLRRRTNEYRWYQSALRMLVEDAIPIIPSAVTSAADVILSPVDMTIVRDSYTRKGRLMPTGIEASHRRAVGVATVLEAVCRWISVEAEGRDPSTTPVKWEVIVGAVAQLMRRLPMQNGGTVGGRSVETAASSGAAAPGTHHADAGPAWVTWSNLSHAVDNAIAAVTVERHRYMFIALAAAARAMSAIVYHDQSLESGATGYGRRASVALDDVSPHLISEALLGVERVAANVQDVQIAALAASTVSTPDNGALPVPGHAMKKAAAAAVAAGWAAVHAVTSVPLPSNVRHQTRDAGSIKSNQPIYVKFHDPDDATADPATIIYTQTLPRLLARAVMELSATSAETLLPVLRVVATLLTNVAPDDQSAAMAVELIEAAKGISRGDQNKSRVGSRVWGAPVMAVLGRHVAEAVWSVMKSSRHRKNATMWGAASMAVLHPRLFAFVDLHNGDEPREGTPSSDGGGGGGSDKGDAAVNGVPAVLWFVRATLASGCKSGGGRILRVMAHALCARLITHPEHARWYASEIFMLGLSGEGGLSRAESQAMAAHWAERAAAEERHIQPNGDGRGSSIFGRDAEELARWLDDGGGGGIGGGHAGARIAVMCLVNVLAKAEPPRNWMPDDSRYVIDQAMIAQSKTLSDEALELARERYRLHALCAVEKVLIHGLAALSGVDPQLSVETYRRGSIIHRRKVRAWQLLCAASPALMPLCDPTSVGENGRAFGDVLVAAAPAAVAPHNLPAVRCYAELFMTMGALAFPKLIDDVALPALRDANAKASNVSSWVVVAAGYVLRAPRGAMIRTGRAALSGERDPRTWQIS